MFDALHVRLNPPCSAPVVVLAGGVRAQRVQSERQDHPRGAERNDLGALDMGGGTLHTMFGVVDHVDLV